MSFAKAVQLIKGGSSKWIHDRAKYRKFEWQEGYGAFSVSASEVKKTIAYINNQKHITGSAALRKSSLNCWTPSHRIRSALRISLIFSRPFHGLAGWIRTIPSTEVLGYWQPSACADWLSRTSRETVRSLQLVLNDPYRRSICNNGIGEPSLVISNAFPSIR